MTESLEKLSQQELIIKFKDLEYDYSILKQSYYNIVNLITQCSKNNPIIEKELRLAIETQRNSYGDLYTNPFDYNPNEELIK